jgi:hypothetical protein
LTAASQLAVDSKTINSLPSQRATISSPRSGSLRT